MKYLVQALLNQRKYLKAEQMQRRNVFLKELKLDSKDSESLRSVSVFGAIQARQSQYDGAEELLKRGLSLNKNAFKDEPPQSRLYEINI
jgi:hypothetical protein